MTGGRNPGKSNIHLMGRQSGFPCGKAGDPGMSTEIALGLFLNVLFWAAVVSVVVFAANWWATMWFPGRRRRVRKGIGPSRGKEAPSQVSPVEEPEAERYRKAS
jgi:hypothetical protein